MKLFLSGDVMTGRGIDQILPSPCDPELDEPWVKSALDYVRLAERAKPDARIVNLKTAVTLSNERAPKGINYRMSPANCRLPGGGAHRLLRAREQPRARLGRRRPRGNAPHAALPGNSHRGRGARCRGCRVTSSTGIEKCEKATGVRLRHGELGRARRLGRGARAARRFLSRRPVGADHRCGCRSHPRRKAPGRPRDRLGALGSELGLRGVALAAQLRAPAGRRRRRRPGARTLGASSGEIEIYRGRLILYACGDLINDYEGISGHETYRPGLGLMFFPTLDAATGKLAELALVPMRMRGFRLNRASGEDADWLAAVLREHSKHPVERAANGRLLIQ